MRPERDGCVVEVEVLGMVKKTFEILKIVFKAKYGRF